MDWPRKILTLVVMFCIGALVLKASPWFLLVPLVFGTIGGVSALREQFRNDRWLDRTFKGLCTQCGYDLRGSIIRCPECGHDMEK
jgi:hypothetical protein